MSEVSFSKYLSSKLETEHDIIEINNKFSGEKLKDASKNCFDGCIDSGVVNYSMVSKYINEKNSKVIMFAEGPDELLGGYLADIDANKIDSFFFKKKYLLFFLKNKMIKKLVIKLLELKKNVEFEFKYNPFYTRVNHSVCPNEFLNRIIDNFDLNKTYDYGLLDDEYKEISLNLDNSQKRALIYASKTLPDMFNLRTDKSFMQHSIEARLPFQAISLVEFFIAMPKEYRFKKNLGKYYLRRYIKKIDNALAISPKIGMGESLWRIKSNREFLNMEDTIRKTKFFDLFPFKKNIKETLLDEKTHPGNLWSAYALINTFDELEKINKQKYF
jgi:asparagine synthetase B (glutamine-hydrolysing)